MKTDTDEYLGRAVRQLEIEKNEWVYEVFQRAVGAAEALPKPDDGGLTVGGATHLGLALIADTIPVDATTVAIACSPTQNNVNLNFARSWRSLGRFCNQIEAEAQRIDDSSVSGIPVQALCREYIERRKAMPSSYYRCDPTYADVAAAWSEFANAYNSANVALEAASNRLFNNAEARFSAADGWVGIVRVTRQSFETTTFSGGVSLQNLQEAHESYLAKEREVTVVRFGDWYDAHNARATAFYNRTVDMHNLENSLSTIDDLDQLRDEYVTETAGIIAVPARSDFTLYKRSRYFDFTALNQSDYRWAILSDRLLNTLDTVCDNFGAGALSINAGYRNPSRNHNVGGVYNSRHMYGDAADVQPIDLTGDGLVNKDDQDVLVDAARTAGFTEIVRERIAAVHMGFD